MNARSLTMNEPGRSGIDGPGVSSAASVLKLGTVVSVLQSALFVVIGVAGLMLGVDRLIDDGFASLALADPNAFRVLCLAFVLIAVLGLAITGAERALIEPSNVGLARFGAVLAYLGHAGTIAFFSWWLIRSFHISSRIGLDVIAPLDWGVMFELVFVGAWVWIIAILMRGQLAWPAGFVVLSVVKAASFWFAFIAFLTDQKWMIVLGLGAVTFVTGPLWHLWIPRLFLRSVREERDHAR
jgi:hypothetical protein